MVTARFESVVKPERTVVYRSIVATCGVILVIAAALISNNAIENALVSDPQRSLSWGPALFRVLLACHGLALMLCALMWARRDESKENSYRLGVNSSLTLDNVTTRSTWIALAVMSAIAFGLRFWQLNSDLWFDELLTLLNFVRLPLGDIVTSLPDQNNHLLFTVLSYGSVRIFGESAWAVRLPSVVFGVLSIWALFLLGRRVIGTRQSLFACALMTVSYHHVWFSQNARGYMALLFFSLLATWLWIEALENEGWGWWIGYAMAVTGGMLSHMTMAFVVAGHVVIYLAMLIVSRKKGTPETLFESDHSLQYKWRPFVALALSVGLTLQFYALALPEFLRVGLHEVSLESEWTSPWWVITETLRNLRIGFSGALVVLCGGVLVGLGWLNMLRRQWWTGVLMVLSAVLAGGTMLALGHNLWPRFFFFAMGFALLIAVHGAMTVPRIILGWLPLNISLEKTGATAGVVLASVMIVASALTVPRNYSHPKQDYSGARDYVEGVRGTDDKVVAVGLAGVAYGRYFAPKWAVAQTEIELENARRGNSNVWLVYTLSVEVKAYRPELWQTIQRDFEVVKVFPGTLGGGEVFVCRQRTNTGTPLTASL